MYRVGAAAKRLNLLPEASVIMGIPLSAKGKNIFFDRNSSFSKKPQKLHSFSFSCSFPGKLNWRGGNRNKYQKRGIN